MTSADRIFTASIAVLCRESYAQCRIRLDSSLFALSGGRAGKTSLSQPCRSTQRLRIPDSAVSTIKRRRRSADPPVFRATRFDKLDTDRCCRERLACQYWRRARAMVRCYIQIHFAPRRAANASARRGDPRKIFHSLVQPAYAISLAQDSRSDQPNHRARFCENGAERRDTRKRCHCSRASAS